MVSTRQAAQTHHRSTHHNRLAWCAGIGKLCLQAGYGADRRSAIQGMVEPWMAQRCAARLFLGQSDRAVSDLLLLGGPQVHPLLSLSMMQPNVHMRWSLFRVEVPRSCDVQLETDPQDLGRSNALGGNVHIACNTTLQNNANGATLVAGSRQSQYSSMWLSTYIKPRPPLQYPFHPLRRRAFIPPYPQQHRAGL